MINAKELRCGNLIQFADKMQPHGAYGDPGPYMTVYGIVEEVKVYYGILPDLPPLEEIRLHTFVGPFKPEKLSGIPLTEDWVKRLQFKRNNVSSDIAVQYEKDDNTVEISKDGKVFYSPTDCYWIELKHVHRLQNLHFSLTEIELNYQP